MNHFNLYHLYKNFQFNNFKKPIKQRLVTPEVIADIVSSCILFKISLSLTYSSQHGYRLAPSGQKTFPNQYRHHFV